MCVTDTTASDESAQIYTAPLLTAEDVQDVNVVGTSAVPVMVSDCDRLCSHAEIAAPDVAVEARLVKVQLVMDALPVPDSAELI